MEIKIEKKIYFDEKHQDWAGNLKFKFPKSLPDEYRDNLSHIFWYPLNRLFPEEISKNYFSKDRDSVVLMMEDCIEVVQKTLERVKRDNLKKMEGNIEEIIILEV